MSAAKLMDGLSPAQWRALNALFCTGRRGINALTLRDGQRIEWQQVVDLEAGGFVVAYVGADIQFRLADMTAPSHVLRIRLSSRGDRKVVRNGPNQVICTLGGHANLTARVHDCRTEGGADDDLLLKMHAAGLIVPQDAQIGLSMFKRLPRDLALRLTNNGRAYFPLDTVGASA